MPAFIGEWVVARATMDILSAPDGGQSVGFEGVPKSGADGGAPERCSPRDAP
jgi:hypothetical protein